MPSITDLKDDAEEIKQFLSNLEKESWITPSQKLWPRYLYRVENIDSAAKILNSGKILSRSSAISSGVMATDSGSSTVLNITSDKWKEHVRLYFRPRTPTQHNTEGFRKASEYTDVAQRPVPVVFLLDSKDILCRRDTIFSNGNLAGSAITGKTSKFLKEHIPFEKVYHDTWFDPSDRDQIIFHRHAEVCVPNELDLNSLKLVACRTQAEHATLLDLLDQNARNKWGPKIGLAARGSLHFRYWMFIENVDLASDRILFHFNPSSRTTGPFKMIVKIVDSGGKTQMWEKNEYVLKPLLPVLHLRLVRPTTNYHVNLTIDGKLAFSSSFNDISVPF